MTTFCAEVHLGGTNAIGLSSAIDIYEGDEEVLRLNESAHEQLQCEKSLAIVPHATHLFEEPGALEEVARLATDWFRKHLRKRT